MSNEWNNNGLLDDAKFRETVFSMYPQLRELNFDDSVFEVLPAWDGNTAVENIAHIVQPNIAHQSLVHHNTQLNDSPNNHVPVLPYNRTSSTSRWTAHEQRLFLEGLKIYGKGKWRSISRHIKTRTSVQVASHAQKYFVHLRASDKKKRRSIHDMTLQEEDHKSILVN